ncbi:MAG: hypothetical protein C0603_00750 [Denitrovibrio sp.]|nr:MAG: hypothetical protein C0603_00750 [Denitrovibrio sp.]
MQSNGFTQKAYYSVEIKLKMTNALTITDLQKELLAVKQTYNELHCHDQRKMLALDDVPVFELTIDKEAKITNLSKGFEKVMEYTCEDYLNKSFTELLADEDEITGHYANFEMFKVKGTIYKKHWRMKKPSGEVITVMHSARAIYDDCGEFNGAVGFVLDVSASVNANRALVRSEREKRLILDIMSEGVIYFDKELKVIWANRVMSDFFGSFADDIENKRCREFCPGRNTGCATCPIMKSLHTKTKQISEVSYNSISCVMQVHPVLDNDEDIISLVTVITDITERKLLERQIVDLSNNERKRIGHDLHDGLGQMLSAISIMSSSLLDIMDKKEGQEFELVQKIVKHTDESQEMMRRILDGLCPVFD